MNNKILVVIVIILVAVIIGGAYWFLIRKSGSAPEIGNQPAGGQEATAGAGSEEPLSEQPNKEKFDEYLTSAYLAKLPGTAEFNPWAIEKTKVFVLSDQFCTSMDIRKDIATGTLAGAVYDTTNKQYVKPKSVFPMLMKQGGSIGCEPLDFPIGKYEQKIYIDNVLTVVLPFEVK